MVVGEELKEVALVVENWRGGRGDEGGGRKRVMVDIMRMMVVVMKEEVEF